MRSPRMGANAEVPAAAADGASAEPSSAGSFRRRAEDGDEGEEDSTGEDSTGRNARLHG